MGGILIFVVVSFLAGMFALNYYTFFAPKFGDAKRKVFEEQQSYVHGKIQDLAKYYDEYTKVELRDREAIRQLIIMRFAEFDESKIQSPALRGFLTKMRGY
jgi:hypothetical protein